MRLSVGILLAWLHCSLSVSACGSVDVCGDISSSLGGSILTEDGIRIDWETDGEDSTVDRYEIHRYDCESPTLCLVHVTTISRRGTCSNNEEYTYNDNPPDPDEDWTYRLQVHKNGLSVPVCEYDIDPE